MKNNIMPNIFDYNDYHELLKDLFDYHRSNNKNFTYRYFSQRAGYSSSGILKDVIEGRKKIPIKSCRKFITPFKLSQKQADYFELLVHFNTAKAIEDRRKLFRELIKYQRSPESNEITKKEYKFYRKWYYGAIRELVGLDGFRNDPKWISKKLFPNITIAQAKEALKVLLDLGFVVKGKDGTLNQAVPKLTIDPDASVVYMKNLARQMIELEWESLDSFNSKERDRLGLTMHMSKESYNDVRSIIRRVQEEVLDCVSKNKDKSEIVCHLGLCLFPLIKDNGGNGNKEVKKTGKLPATLREG